MKLANSDFAGPAEIFVNGRFLAQSLSGVQRFARELLLALDELLAEGVVDRDRFRLTVLQPRSVAEPVGCRHIAMREIGRSTGHVWEQTELPAHVRGKPPLNFCNTAPLLKRNQVLTIHDAAVRAVPQAYTRVFHACYRVMHSLQARTPCPRRPAGVGGGRRALSQGHLVRSQFKAQPSEHAHVC